MDPRPTLLQAESSGWLFKSPLAWGGGILWQHPTGRTAYYYSESLGYAVLPLEGRITAWCRPAPCLSVPFWPISPEEKVVKTSDLRFTDTPFWGKKVKVTWTGWIFESTQHWFTSLCATYPRKRASALPDSCAYVIRQAQLFMRLIHIRISPQNFLFCLH